MKTMFIFVLLLFLFCAECQQTLKNSRAPVNPYGWFKIYSEGYKKCLTSVYTSTRRYSYYLKYVKGKLVKSRKVASQKARLVLKHCSAAFDQDWRWLSTGQLQSSLHNYCLTVRRSSQSKLFQYKASLQPCILQSGYKQWTCSGGYLKLKYINLYLIPYLFKNAPSGGVVIRRSITASCKWTRYGTSNTICEDDTTANVKWFKIKNSKYQLCLTLRTFHFFGTVITKFTLATCLPNASRQLWQFTANKKLRLKYNNKCLTFDGHLKLTLRPCSFVNLPQQWSCSQRRLLLERILQYLVPYPYSGMPFGFMILMRRSCPSKNKACQWTQSTNLPVCSNSKDKETTALTTMPISSTTKPTTKEKTFTSTVKQTLTAIPSVLTKDEFGTPPLPPTDIQIGTNVPPAPPLPEIITPTPPPGNKNVSCGTKGNIGEVVNGTKVEVGNTPWQVGIKRCHNCIIRCGGTLINDQWVVTAAHCVTGWLAEELFLVVGEVDQSKISGQEQLFKCTKIITHEDYGLGAPFDKDIALLKLDKYAVLNDYVRPLCLPESGTILGSQDFCQVSGFGRVTRNGEKSTFLLEANINIVDLETCKKAYEKLSRKVTSNMLCAGYRKGGTDACQGDSGGPLTCYNRNKVRFTLGGIVSWGVGCAQPDRYGVYTNTAVFTPWIEKKLKAYSK